MCDCVSECVSVSVLADPRRLPLQYVQRCGRVDGELQPHWTSEQQAVQHADALQGASASLVAQELALGLLRRLREVVEGLLLLRHLGRRSTKELFFFFFFFFCCLSNPEWQHVSHWLVAVII